MNVSVFLTQLSVMQGITFPPRITTIVNFVQPDCKILFHVISYFIFQVKANIYNVQGSIFIFSKILKHFLITGRIIELFLYLHTGLHVKYAMFSSDFNQN
jgi:hypothetical protein